MTVVIPTNREGVVFLVDDEDAEMARARSWYIDGDGYPTTTVRREGRSKNVRFHRFLFPDTGELVVDHRNRNPLDNQRHNLRPVTQLVNVRNKRAGGVYFRRDVNAWTAQIGDGGNGRKHMKYLGTFDLRETAEEVRRAAEVLLWGATHEDVSPDALTWVRGKLDAPRGKHIRKSRRYEKRAEA